MHIPNEEELGKLPDLLSRARELKEIIAKAKDCRKTLKATEKEIKAILKGPTRTRKPRTPKAAKAPKPAKLQSLVNPAQTTRPDTRVTA